MKPFDLSEWLANPSRKVVTRRGNPVRIICTDRKHGEDDLPIVFLEENNGGEFLLTCRNDGRCDNYDTQYDLFFADEEEELTEFETAIYHDVCTIVTDCEGTIYGDKELKTIVKGIAKVLLNLARKEVLKSLPKWKKATEKKDLEKHIAIFEEGKVLLSNYLEEGDYYIDLEDLKTLPKEE